MNTIDILKKARENIASPESWITCELIDKRMGGTCYCALGAVCAVEFPEGLRQYAEEPDPEIDAYDLLEDSAAVAALVAAIPEEQAVPRATRNVARVYGFNDATTHGDVLALFDTAIANEQAKSDAVIYAPNF